MLVITQTSYSLIGIFLIIYTDKLKPSGLELQACQQLAEPPDLRARDDAICEHDKDNDWWVTPTAQPV